MTAGRCENAREPVGGRGVRRSRIVDGDNRGRAGRCRGSITPPSALYHGAMALKKLKLSVGELAQRAGIAPSAVRFYEEQGLIFSRRTSGNQRRYHRAMLRRVAFIRASQSAGIPLAVIGEVLAELGDHESPSKAMWEAASQRWIADINHRIALLENMRDMIGSCVGCGCLSLGECHLLNPGDELNQLGPGPRRLMRD